MVASLLGPVRRDHVAVGVARDGPELVGEPQVVTDEEAQPHAFDVDGDELVAGVVALVLARVRERVDLAVPADGAVGTGQHETVRRTFVAGLRVRVPSRTPTRRARAACSSRNCALGPSNGSAIRSVSIEKPVAYISVSTTSRAPFGRRALDHRGEAGEVGRGVLPHDVVLDGGDPHRAQALQASHGLVDDVEPLAEREPHERQPGGAVVVEDDVGDRDHAAALRKRAAEREPVVLAEAAGCRW